MATLLLRLAAPLQAWGSSSKFNIRTTEREPTKSGIIGMIAAAMGFQRNAPMPMLETLSSLRFGVRVDREGKLLRDFHMVHEQKQGKGKVDSHLTERYYFSDAVFLVALETKDAALLQKVADALKHPVYPLFLGRRSCPPTLPVVLGVRDSALREALLKEPALVEKPDSARRIVYDTASGGTPIQDVPVSFSQLHRQHGSRMKQEEFLLEKEHDPMAEL